MRCRLRIFACVRNLLSSTKDGTPRRRDVKRDRRLVVRNDERWPRTSALCCLLWIRRNALCLRLVLKSIERRILSWLDLIFALNQYYFEKLKSSLYHSTLTRNFKFCVKKLRKNSNRVNFPEKVESTFVWLSRYKSKQVKKNRTMHFDEDLASKSKTYDWSV